MLVYPLCYKLVSELLVIGFRMVSQMRVLLEFILRMLSGGTG